jgi:transposase-like protein
MYTKEQKQAILATYRETLGNLSATCRAHKVSRSTFGEWCKKDPEFAAEVEEVKEEFLDFAEECLVERMRAGDTTAIIFALKSKGKQRGWGEKSEMQVDLTSSGKPIRYADIMPHS